MFLNRRLELLIYKRFIEDLFMLWAGTEDMCRFLRLNSNAKISGLENKNKKYVLCTVIRFKETDRNSYLSILSGHHWWLSNIPGQIYEGLT